MNITDFDYVLPKELIAQIPKEERSSSRLLVLKRGESLLEHRHFADLADYLHEGDTLVLNETKVFPAKLTAVKETGGRVNILLVERTEGDKWKCLVNGVKRGTREIPVFLGDETAVLKEEGLFWTIRFPGVGGSDEAIRKYGTAPLPPYIKRDGGTNGLDLSRYQTVYAQTEGSIAAPTAGFHFTREMLDRLQALGINIVEVTLHIGVGTFFPIKAESVEDHKMHQEYYEIKPQAREIIHQAKAEGRRVVACGTSVVRTLETVFSGNGNGAFSGYTELYIHPGYRFRVVDAMITNFHLPRSTPMMLVSALAGREALLASYTEAIERGYRFYSYGDAMLIL
jgi:S-adenosylmethionine:tRNA ribosyltransferase-isomerase